MSCLSIFVGINRCVNTKMTLLHKLDNSGAYDLNGESYKLIHFSGSIVASWSQDSSLSGLNFTPRSGFFIYGIFFLLTIRLRFVGWIFKNLLAWKTFKRGRIVLNSYRNFTPYFLANFLTVFLASSGSVPVRKRCLLNSSRVIRSSTC